LYGHGGLAIYARYAYTCCVAIEFDPKKNAINLRRHGVTLSEGDGVLSDPLALTIEDVAAAGERRFATIGTNVFGSLMVVSGPDAERISASSRYEGHAEGTAEL
jgi:uncharacterized DUF497 family protein